MNLRRAEPTELAACAALSTQVQSAYVWQVQVERDATQPLVNTEIAVALRCIRLPRPVMLQTVDPHLEELWRVAELVLVAEEGDAIAGYAVLTQAIEQPAWILARLVVAPALRLRGLGSQLIREAARLAQEQGQQALLAACPVRNHPAVACLIRGGLNFAGYSEATYARGDIALLWQRTV
ncbi:MAG: GNAT family N-acetyltransferase [Herpetosiphonaceae bacterium]|nr:GNAT family N-acetyltransferase [Herpetosiphonaceae bacterium]